MCLSAFRCFVFMFSRNGGHQWPSGMSKHLKPRIPNKRFRRSALMEQQLFDSKTEIFDFRPDTIDRHPTHIFLFQNIEFPERCAIWNSPRTPTTPISSFTRLNETPTLAENSVSLQSKVFCKLCFFVCTFLLKPLVWVFTKRTAGRRHFSGTDTSTAFSPENKTLVFTFWGRLAILRG